MTLTLGPGREEQTNKKEQNNKHMNKHDDNSCVVIQASEVTPKVVVVVAAAAPRQREHRAGRAPARFPPTPPRVAQSVKPQRYLDVTWPVDAGNRAVALFRTHLSTKNTGEPTRIATSPGPRAREGPPPPVISGAPSPPPPHRPGHPPLLPGQPVLTSVHLI